MLTTNLLATGAFIFCAAPAGIPGGKGRRRRPPLMALALLLLAVIGIFWIAGRQTPWSPTYQAPPLPASVVRASAGPVYDGAQLFHRKACLNCHRVEGYGGRRGPDLTDIAARKTAAQMIAVIKSGGRNMPAYGSRLAALELSEIVAFLESRKQGLRH